MCVIGAGQFGTCLAQHLASLDHQVFLWSRSCKISEGIQRQRRNLGYLSDYNLHANIVGTSEDLEELSSKVEVIVLAVPTQVLRSVLKKIGKKLSSSTLLICAAKGVELSTHNFPLDIIKDTLGIELSERSVYFSGPSFANEIMQALPTAVSVAGKSREQLLLAQSVFHSSKLRVYTSSDVIGLEVAGALKNVVAIGTGVCQGLEYGSNSLAALITRGLAEIVKVGVTLGAHVETFLGLGGVGDLFLTCSSQNSRNFRVGYQLAKGKTLGEVIRDLGSTAEGVATAKAAHNLCLKLKVRHPIIELVYQILYEDLSVEKAVYDLLTSSPREEFELGYGFKSN